MIVKGGCKIVSQDKSFSEEEQAPTRKSNDPTRPYAMLSDELNNETTERRCPKG